MNSHPVHDHFLLCPSSSLNRCRPCGVTRLSSLFDRLFMSSHVSSLIHQSVSLPGRLPCMFSQFVSGREVPVNSSSENSNTVVKISNSLDERSYVRLLE